MRRIIFYSWQSDLPNATNRGLIQRALEAATASIASDNSVGVEPVVDRDTAGVPGSPDISATIFGKISAADVFVADVSIVSRPRKGRACPNPNVLIELGYALKAVGPERVLLVFNEAYGKLSELPFDLRTRRVLTYDMPENAQERATTRSGLQGKCDEAIRAALGHAPAPPLAPSRAVEAIEEHRANRVVTLRKELDEAFDGLKELQPTTFSAGGTTNNLIAAFVQTQAPLADFSKLMSTVAVMNDTEAALEILRWFGKLLEEYDLPRGFSGTFNAADFDFFKLVGHEWMVTVFAFLLREQRWDLMRRLFRQPIMLRYSRDTGGPANVDWFYASAHASSLMVEGQKAQRMSLHADILHERHSSGGLATILPFDEFTGADLFLYLRAELSPKESPGHRMMWRPWSTLYLRSPPSFILQAELNSDAREIAQTLGVDSINDFKTRLSERGPRLRQLFSNGFWDWPVNRESIDRIGTRS